MKKVLMVILLALFIGVIAIALHNTNVKAVKSVEESNASSQSNDADIVITDSYFIQATNDVYLNLDNYMGKTIKMEGFVYEYTDYSNNSHIAVVRNSPGCCGNDGLAGLDIECGDCLSNETWVEIVGKIKSTTIDNKRVPIVEVTSMVQKPEGKKFVTN